MIKTVDATTIDSDVRMEIVATIEPERWPPHDWCYSAGPSWMKVSEHYPFRYCTICGKLIVNGEVIAEDWNGTKPIH